MFGWIVSIVITFLILRWMCRPSAAYKHYAAIELTERERAQRMKEIEQECHRMQMVVASHLRGSQAEVNELERMYGEHKAN